MTVHGRMHTSGWILFASQLTNDLVMMQKSDMCALQVCERLVGQATDQQKATSSHLYPVLCTHEGPIPQVRLFAACVVISDLLVPDHSAYKQASIQGRPDVAKMCFNFACFCH